MSNTELINGVSASIWNATKVPGLIGTSVFFIVLTLATISLRFYARLSSRAPLWWDDWFALATVPLALLNPILDLVQIQNGFGRHQIVMLRTDPQKAEQFGHVLYMILIFYPLGLAVFKYSFLALYIRLFFVSKSLRYQSYGLGVLITMWSVACVFAVAFRCNPVEANWKPVAGTCIPLEPIFLAQSVPTITFDVLILLLPLRIVWGIQMARPARVGVISVFLLGGIVTLISVVRLIVLLRQSSEDLPWDYVSIGLWSAAEPITGLLCCCLPTYAPLMRRLVKRTSIGSWKSGNGSSQKETRSKTKLAMAVPSTGYPERATRSYWVGYKRSEKDSDTFQLTDMEDGNVVKEGHAGGPLDQSERSLEHTPWNREGIHITQEVDIRTES